MEVKRSNASLTTAEMRAIIDDAERQVMGGWAGAIARAGLGTLALVLAVFAATDTRTVGLILLCGLFILALVAYIRSVARSVSKKPRISAQPVQPQAVPPTGLPETAPVTPAVPATALAGIAGGSWSRLAPKRKV